ncbi:MAG: hypothetical protein Q9213_002579 [Squamulea squamosa]
MDPRPMHDQAPPLGGPNMLDPLTIPPPPGSNARPHVNSDTNASRWLEENIQIGHWSTAQETAGKKHEKVQAVDRSANPAVPAGITANAPIKLSNTLLAIPMDHSAQDRALDSSHDEDSDKLTNALLVSVEARIQDQSSHYAHPATDYTGKKPVATDNLDINTSKGDVDTSMDLGNEVAVAGLGGKQDNLETVAEVTSLGPSQSQQMQTSGVTSHEQARHQIHASGELSHSGTGSAPKAAARRRREAKRKVRARAAIREAQEKEAQEKEATKLAAKQVEAENMSEGKYPVKRINSDLIDDSTLAKKMKIDGDKIEEPFLFSSDDDDGDEPGPDVNDQCKTYKRIIERLDVVFLQAKSRFKELASLLKTGDRKHVKATYTDMLQSRNKAMTDLKGQRVTLSCAGRLLDGKAELKPHSDKDSEYKNSLGP